MDVRGALAVRACVMTAASIGAGKAGGYARYLEGKTMVPDRGDYYLHPSGEPTQTAGRWLSSPDTLTGARHRRRADQR